MKIQYTNNVIHKFSTGDPTTCVYQFIYDEQDENDTHITQYFIMCGLGLCIRVNSYVAHLFYAWSFSNNIAIIIVKKKKNTAFC